MGVYYHVRMLNPLLYRSSNGEYLPTETQKELGGILVYRSGSCEENVLGVSGIRNIKATKTGLFGIEYNGSVDNPILMICEDTGTYLVDVITGNKYEKGPNNSFYDRYKEIYHNKLLLAIVEGVSSSAVASELRGLSSYEIELYRKKMKQVDKAIAIGYEKDMQRIKNNKTLIEEDDSYIKNFRNNHGK